MTVGSGTSSISTLLLPKYTAAPVAGSFARRSSDTRFAGRSSDHPDQLLVRELIDAETLDTTEGKVRGALHRAVDADHADVEPGRDIQGQFLVFGEDRSAEAEGGVVRDLDRFVR